MCCEAHQPIPHTPTPSFPSRVGTAVKCTLNYGAMMNAKRATAGAAVLLPLLVTSGASGQRAQQGDQGFVSLFNGRDLAGWKIPDGDHGHWRVVDGVIDYDAGSEAAGDKSLWTEREYGDFILRVDWRIKETPYTNPNVHIVKPDGTSKLDAAGKPVLMAVPDSDSGIYLRG